MKDLLTQKELRKEYRISHKKLMQFEDEGLKGIQKIRRQFYIAEKNLKNLEKKGWDRRNNDKQN